MKKTLLNLVLASAAVTLLVSFDLPKDWFKSGDKVDSYEMGIAKGAGPAGENAATIKSTEKKINGFGTLMQSCSPKQYLGKKVKMSGLVKTQDVSGWAGLWMRVDGSGRDVLEFDNMHDRTIRKTTNWKRYEVTLDVSDKAENLAYGSLLVGTGQVWFTDVRFEIVGPVDGKDKKNLSTRMNLEAPSNLDFKEE